ncbi:MJ0042 family finger-like domain-containing protein [Polaromonas sp. OV174]|uniref:DUF3426 domain-containing protein n=1 Tax=Polaromonas sp. OV174 TaxID=1855300 RepID=UPI0008E54852|nr:DUF3426 domain-containing protein [Polaromonas sp. OV174]SFB67550.1 MJ0042 family finger-like domain-containing protein [Polaromonas sp. OV174]
MSLITRCPSCGTMFKVVADQLKVAQGWVRCGHCSEVFDASAQLQADEAARSGAVASAPEALAAVQQSAPSQLAAEPEPPEETAKSLAVREAVTPEALAPNEAGDFDPASWKQARQLPDPESEHVPASASALDDTPGPQELAHTQAAADEAETDVEPAEQQASMAAEPDAEQDVSFVRDAQRKAFWKKPLIRGLLACLALALLVALALQWVVQQRDRLVALEPRLLPALQALCVPLRCDIRPPRHIESLVIDSSSFNHLGAETYRLSFTLKNTGPIPLEIPLLELSLTDTRDQTLLRRVLLPAQFGASGATLAAHSELAGVLSLKVASEAEQAAAPLSPSSAPALPLRVAGYRILAFYP